MFVESQGGDLGGKLLGVLPGWAIYGADLIFAMYVLINLMGCLWLFTGITEYHRGGRCWLESVGEAGPASLIQRSHAHRCMRMHSASWCIV